MQGLGWSVVSDILAALAIAILGWLLSIFLRLPFVFRQRRDLFRFLGITRSNHRFTVYLSTLFVVMGGSTDFRGNHRTFLGPAIPAAELTIVQPVSELFVSPFLQALPGSIRRWLGEKVHWSFGQISPLFSPSPPDTRQVEPVNMLVVGSQYYNSAGDLYTETGNPYLRMEQVGADMIVRVAKGPREDDVFEKRTDHTDDLAIVERLHDDAHGTTVFIAAGLGVVGTLGAVSYIVKNWHELLDHFGTEPFALCLRFQDIVDDPNAHKKPVVLSRFPAH